MTDKVDKVDIFDYFMLIEQLNTLKIVFERRIDFILRTIHEVFNHELSYWYTSNGVPKGEIKLLTTDRWQPLYGGISNYITVPQLTMRIILNEEEWALDYSFPIKWLFENNF